MQSCTPRQSFLDTYRSSTWQKIAEQTWAITSTDAKAAVSIDDNSATRRIGMCQPTHDEVWEGHVAEAQARVWVAERGYYGGIGYLEDELANAQKYRSARERVKRSLAKLVAARD